MQSSPSLFASAGDCIKVWNANAEQVTVLGHYTTKNLSSGSNFKDIAWNSNNTKLAGVSNGSGILLYDFHEGGRNDGVEIPKSGEQTSVCFGNGKAELYSGGATGDVNLWNCDSCNLVKTFDGTHKSPIRRMTKLTDGGIVSACTDGEVIIWHPDSGKAQTKLKTSKSKSVRGLEHSKYHREMLCTTSDDGIVCIWDIDKQSMKHTFAQHDAPAMDLSFSTINGLLLASCGLDKKIIFYDTRGNNIVKTIMCNQPVTAVCFLTNGMHVCAGTSMGNIVLYDLRHNSEPLSSIQAHSTSVQRLVLQTLKERKRSSRVESRSSASQRKSTHNKDEEKPSTIEKAEQSMRPSKDHIANRLSKVKVELPPNETESNGDNHLSPATSAPNRKSHLERSLGLQTPLNKSTVSSKRDTLGSYCEGIFSPVASVNGSIHSEVFAPQSSSKVQRTSRGNLQPSQTLNSNINFDTPAVQHPNRSSLRDSYIGGLQIPDAQFNGFAQRGSIAEKGPSSTKPPIQMYSSTPTNPMTNSASSLSPDSEDVSTTRKTYRPSEDASVDTVVNGNNVAVNHSGAAAANFLPQSSLPQSNPFQYQLDFLKNTVHELIENHEDNMRDELRHLHIQIIKMFAELNDRTTQLAEQCSVNPLLLQEIERLRAENDRLRRKF